MARVQAAHLAGESPAHAAPRVLQPRAAASADARSEAGLRAQRRLPRAAAHGQRPRDGAARPRIAGRAEHALRTARRRAVPCGRASDETPLHGGVHLPDDEVGNCRQFTTLLRAESQRIGVRFRFHTQVQKVIPGKAPQLVHLYAPPEESTLVTSAAGESAPNDAQDTQPMALHAITESFDAIVVCAALDSAALLRPHGLRLPMQAVYGYSITAPLRRVEAHGDIGPRSALMDERYKVAISRLGARVRVAGSAEIGGSATRHDPKALQTLYKVLHDWFPGAARLTHAQVWKGVRPMLPDGPPVIGHSGIEGVWLNLGHGSSGWALSCGSARLIADSIAGRAPPIDTEGLGVERLRD
ncbi:MAG: FAD-dependent oxidoreductase [Pseudomonadota bacterium]